MFIGLFGNVIVVLFRIKWWLTILMTIGRIIVCPIYNLWHNKQTVKNQSKIVIIPLRLIIIKTEGAWKQLTRLSKKQFISIVCTPYSSILVLMLVLLKWSVKGLIIVKPAFLRKMVITIILSLHVRKVCLATIKNQLISAQECWLTRTERKNKLKILKIGRRKNTLPKVQ